MNRGKIVAGAVLAAACLYALGSGASAPKRIVSTAPALTEMLFAVGAGARVVGVTDFCTWPAEARRLPRIGGAINPNLEAVLALRPDLVVLYGAHPALREFCRRHTIPVADVYCDTWATITNAIARIGALTGHAAEAAALRAGMTRRWEAVRTRAAGRAPLRVLLCGGRGAGPVAACMTMNGASFVSEALAVAGGSNVFAGVAGSYPEVAAEAIMARAPEAIVELRPGEALTASACERLRREWSTLASTPAVRGQRVFFVTNDFALIPGPRLVEIAETFERMLATSNVPPTPRLWRASERPADAKALAGKQTSRPK